MNTFVGREGITLMANDDSLPYTFTIPVATSTTTRDGWIPYGTNVADVDVTITRMLDDSVVTGCLQGSSVSDNVIALTFSYPTTSGIGQCQVKMDLTLDSGATATSYFDKLFIE